MRVCWLSVAFAVILFACLVSVARMLLPMVNDYRDDLETLAGQVLGRTVQIESVKAEWYGLWPALRLQNVVIRSNTGDRDWVIVKQVYVKLDWFNSIRNRRFEPAAIILSGTSLDITHRDNDYIVNGELLHMLDSSAATQRQVVEWLFQREEIEIHDSHVTIDQDGGRGNLAIENMGFTLRNSDNLHHAHGHMQLAGQGGRQIQFVLDLTGNVFEPEKVTQRFYLAGDMIVTPRIRSWLQPHVSLEGGELQVKIWGQGGLFELEHLRSKLQARDVAWSIPQESTDTGTTTQNRLDHLGMEIFWHKQATGWSLDIERFNFAREGSEWPESNMRFAYYRTDNHSPASLEGELGFLRLQDVSHFLAANLPSTLAARSYVRDLDMRGDLSHFQFRYLGDDQELQDIYASADFKDLGFNSFRGIPGGQGLDGHLVLNRQSGVLRLDSHDTTLDFGNLFRAPLVADILRGEVSWRRSENGWVLNSDRLEAINKSVRALSRVRVDLPDSRARPFLDMEVAFEEARGADAGDYLPRRILHHNVLKWLDRALVDGRVPAGKMLFHGWTSDFPFDGKQGTFLVRFDVEDAILDYGAGWPRVHGFEANVQFLDRSMTVVVKNGLVQDMRTTNSSARIADLGNRAVLEMDLNLQGHTRDALKFLVNSPAGTDYREFLEKVEGSGENSIHLTMSLPLYDPQAYTMKGAVNFNRSGLLLQDWKRRFEEISGRLDFAYDGKLYRFTSDSLQGKFQGKPATIDVATSVARNRLKTQVTVRSQLTVQDLLHGIVPSVPDVFEGASDWALSLNLEKDVAAKSHDASLVVESNLAGTAVNLPDGFGKSAKESRKLHANIRLAGSEVRSMDFDYGKVLSGIFSVTHKDGQLGLDRGSFRFGGGQVSLPREPGVTVTGKLARFSLSRWFDQFGKPGDKPFDARQYAFLSSLDVEVGNVQYSGFPMHNVKLILHRIQNAYHARVHADEISGEITMPMQLQGEAPLVVQLNYLKLGFDEASREKEVLDPRKLPSLQLTCQKLTLNGKDFGELNINARHISEGLLFERFDIDSETLTVKATGTWKYIRNQNESSFEIKAKSPSVEKAFALLGYQASIEGGQFDLDIAANWNGPPHLFEMQRLNGTVHLSVKKGQLRDVSPGGGRIFGLLSLHTLPRRLSLDFSDIFKKGFSFDSIEGNFSIADGNAFTNDLHLDGPSAHIDVQGRIGLAARDYDQTVVVIPSLSSTIPVIGGLAGGPQVAIGLYLTEKLLGNRLNKMTSVKYAVTGSWDDPKVHRIETNGTPESPKANRQ